MKKQVLMEFEFPDGLPEDVIADNVAAFSNIVQDVWDLTGWGTLDIGDGMLGELADFLANVIECYSRSGEFNNFSAPLGTVQIRESAREFALKIGAQLPDESEED